MLPQHKPTNKLELDKQWIKKKQCNNSALLLFGCTYLGSVYFPSCPLPADSSVNLWFKSEHLDADFSMHFGNVFLNWSCPYILAQGGGVSVFGTTVLFWCIWPDPPPFSPSSSTFFLPVCTPLCVCTDCSENKAWLCFFIWQVKRKKMNVEFDF